MSTLDRIASQPRKGDRIVLIGGHVAYEVAVVSSPPDVLRVVAYVPMGRISAPGGGLLIDSRVWYDFARCAGSWTEGPAGG